MSYNNESVIIYLFNEWPGQIILNLLSSVIFFVIGILSYKFYNFKKKRISALSYILPFDSDKTPIHISYGLVNPRSQDKYYMVEEGDLTALYKCVDIFSHLYKQDRIVVLNHLAIESILPDIEHLITISGPLWNRMTELFIGKLGSPVFFDRTSGNVIYQESSGSMKRYSTDYDKTNLPIKCFGILLGGEIEASDGKKQKILVCAGNSHLSTYGVILFLRQLYNNRNLKKELKRHNINKSKRWGLIIQVEDRSPSDWHGLTALPINPGYFNISVAEYITHERFLDSYEYRY